MGQQALVFIKTKPYVAFITFTYENVFPMWSVVNVAYGFVSIKGVWHSDHNE